MKGGRKEIKIFQEALSIDANKKGGYEKARDIKYGKWKDTNRI